MFSVEAVGYNGKIHDHFGKLRPVAAGLKDSLSHVVVIPFCHSQTDIRLAEGEMFLSDFLDLGAGDPNRDVIRYEQLPFDHPLFIMYSSGTTGAPKCMVHSVGGTLMKHLEEHQVGRYMRLSIDPAHLQGPHDGFIASEFGIQLI